MAATHGYATFCLLRRGIVLATLCLPSLRRLQSPIKPLREIFVPFEDLNVILESQTQRVFLTRQEYDALVEKAKTKPQATCRTRWPWCRPSTTPRSRKAGR